MPRIPRTKRMRAVLLAPVVGLALLVTACSGGSGNATGGASADSNTPITIAVTAPPNSLDPAQLNEGQQGYVWGSVYDSLLVVDNDNKIQPNAAKSYEYSNGQKTLTLKLRDDLTASDGSKITAKDAAATLNRTLKTPGVQQPKLVNVSSIAAPDDTTLVIELKQPDPALLGYLAQATGVIAKATDLTNKNLALRPVETGPYKIDGKTVDGSSYVLTRRDDYWNAKAYPFKTETVKVIADQTAAFNALQSGEVDFSSIQATQEAAAKGAGLNIARVKASAAFVIILGDREGTIVPALKDERVRQAINMAFDRAAYVKTIFQGNGMPTNQVFNPYGDAYNKSIADMYPFDVQKAKQLLADAGYPNGFKMTMPSTVISQSVEPSVTQSLADIGITVSWDPVPAQNTASSLASQKYPAAVWMAGLNVAPREVNDFYTPTGFLNPFHWDSPELAKLRTEADNASSDSKRAEIYKQISAYATEQALNAPVAYIGSLYATSKGIEYLPTQSVLPTVRTLGLAG